MSIYLSLALLLLLSVSIHTHSIETQCKSCHRITQDFSRGYIETETNHFTGGDVAWEETKLSKYYVSELRFYDIMDNICGSDMPCLSVLEKCENMLEIWWKKNKFDLKVNFEAELFDWLCVQSFEYCCNEGNFGPNCTQCPNNEQSNEICNGQGKCQGDGIRSGSGECLCNHGYEGDTCGMCSNGFYKLDHTCLPCDGSCLLECTDSGPSGCIACRLGYRQGELGCADEDECLESDTCGELEICINTMGSYKCECQNGFIRKDINGACELKEETLADETETETKDEIETETETKDEIETETKDEL